MNRKTGLIILAIAGVMSLGAGAYYMFFMSKTTEHVRLIPKEATFVVKFDNKKLYDKAGMNEEKLKDFFKTLNEKEKEYDAPSGIENLIVKLEKEPFSSGVDIISDVYFFAIGGSDSYAGVVFAVTNENELRKTITDVLQDMEQEFKEQKTDEVNLIVLEDDEDENTLLVAWDEAKGLVLMDESRDSDDAVKQVTELFALKTGASIKSVPGFDRFVAETKDISIWLNGDILDQFNLMELVEEQAGYSLRGASMSMHFEFEKDKISAKGVLHPNEEIKRKQKEMNILGEGISSRLMSRLPKQSYFTFAYSMNPDGIYDLMEKNESLHGMKEEFEGEGRISARDFFDKIGGNMIFSVYDFKRYPITSKVTGDPEINDTTGKLEWSYEDKETQPILPSVALLFDTRNESNFFEEQMQTFVKPFSDKLQKKDDYYILDSEGMQLYILDKDNIVAVTNDEDYVKELAAGKIAESFEQSEWGKQMKGMAGYFRLNFDYASYPEELRESAESYFSDETVTTFKNSIRHLNNIEMRGRENEFEMSVGINNESGDNSLKLLIDAVYDL